MTKEKIYNKSIQIVKNCLVYSCYENYIRQYEDALLTSRIHPFYFICHSQFIDSKASQVTVVNLKLKNSKWETDKINPKTAPIC